MIQFIEDTYAWKNAMHDFPHTTLTLRCLVDGKVEMSQDDADKLVSFLTAEPADIDTAVSAQYGEAMTPAVEFGSKEWFEQIEPEAF